MLFMYLNHFRIMENGKIKHKLLLKLYWAMPYFCIINEKLSEKKSVSFFIVCSDKSSLRHHNKKTKSGSHLFYDIL